MDSLLCCKAPPDDDGADAADGWWMKGSSMSRRKGREEVKRWSNAQVGSILYLTDMETKNAMCYRFLVALVYLCLAVGLLLIWHYLGYHLHIVFWMGRWPQISVFVTMLALVASFLLLMRVRIVRYFRFQELRTEKVSMSRADKTKRSCATEFGRLRPLVLISAVLALGAFGLGLFTVIVGFGIAESLPGPCAQIRTPRIQDLQATSDQLVQFQKECREKKGQENMTATECPDFDWKFPKPHQSVGYLVRLEKSEGCTGFCTPTDPLVFDGRQRKPQAASDLACAEVVGDHVRYATWLVAVPSILVGFVLVIVAGFLWEYEHL